MAISDRLNKLTTDITNAYTSIENKGGTIPANKNTNNLSTAIDSIQSSNIIGATAEGESLSLANTKAMPYSDYVVKGKSEQDGEPSPSNPSEIHSVADDVNLLENMTIYNSNHYISPLLKLNPGTYTFNYTGDSAPGIYIRKNDGSNPTNGTVVDQKYTANNITFSISETGNYYIHLYSSTIWEQLTMNNPKLQKGTVATPYSPYNQGTVKIKQRGKNLFDASKFASAISNGITLSFNSDGNIVLNQTATAQANFNSSHIDMDGSINTGDMVTLSGGSENVTVAIQTFTSDDTYIGASRDSGSTVKYTIPNNASKYAFNIRIPSGTVLSDYVLKPQLEKGSKATTWEPYRANDYTFQTEPLRSLPNGVKDTIEADGIHRRVGVKIFNEDDNFYLGQTLENVLMFGSDTLDNSKLNVSDNNISMSNFFKILYDYTLDEEHFYYTNAGKVYFYINKTELSTQNVAGFKTWLSTHNTEVLYPLAEEIIEPLTQNQATTMLDIIKTGSYEGTTNIYTDEDVKPTIEVDYYKYGETGGLPTVENEKLIFDKELQIDREELIF